MRRLFGAAGAATLAGATLLGLALGGCDAPRPDGPMYYERVIQPILTASCVRNQGSCHKDDGQGNALGNLALTSYADVTRRRDVLRTFGAYPLPLLLLKAAGASVPPIPYQVPGTPGTRFLPSQIDHVGGATIDVQSSAFFELQKWMINGAAEDGAVTARPQQQGTGECNRDFMRVRPDVAAQLDAVDAGSDAVKAFASDVEPLLTKSCAFSTCHSAEQSDLFFTCQGSGSDAATKFNFLQAQAFLGTPPETSELLLKPLQPSAGGVAHTGGVFFTSKDDPTWNKLLAWAKIAGQPAALANLSAPQRFFNDRVMPVLLQRGCMLEACHSPGAANDFKLRGGSQQGFFSLSALTRNYQIARHDFLVADVPDVRRSRLVRKPVVAESEGGIGMVHRGGPPLQSPGDVMDPSACPQPWSEDSSAFCTVVEWHRLEHAALVGATTADALASGDSLGVIAVKRPPNADRLIDFDTYRPGADLVIGAVPLGALGAVQAAGASVSGSLIGNCPGVGTTRDAVDVRGPEVSYDRSRVVFALRTSASTPLDLYEVTLDAAHTCTRLTTGAAANVHSFDPVYGPDGSIVFASTRGKPGGAPSRSIKYGLWQSDLWRLPRSGTGYGAAEQLTALSSSELSPAIMGNGQISFTAEKNVPGSDFYQLSGRRINWDRTDYHPLLAQRAISPSLAGDEHPSVGYGQATEIRETLDRNFVFILSDEGTRGGGGTLATFNRSIGPFQADRADIAFLHAVTIIDSAATGRAGATVGAYRSPIALPDGNFLVSYAPDVRDLGSAPSVRYDVVVVDPRTGARTPLAGFGGGGASWVEAVPVYKREPGPTFANVTQLVFGGSVDADDVDHGVVHYPDLPMLATLLGANLRSGRPVDMMRAGVQLIVSAVHPPAAAGGQGSLEELGRVDLQIDGSAHLRLPALQPVILELVDTKGTSVFKMTEEDQLGPGERISRGVPQRFFNSVCGGCHGSVSGRELDIALDADALTGASVSLSRSTLPQTLGP